MNEQLVLNRYLLQKRIALGGSAEVWHARDRKLRRAVAVKRLHPHLLPDAASRRRLAAEAGAASKLSHPGIVEIYDVDADGEMPALVMELVDGESLATRLERDGPIAADAAARIAADVADALYHAHQAGIVHRDVKPGNILIDRNGRTRLVDFGIAHSLAKAAERVTVAGSVMGTLRYMAPEQLTDGAIGPRTDLFGLGIVLHEMVTGRSPFSATTPIGLAQEEAAGPPQIQGVEPPLAAIISACLEPDPANRPTHAKAVAEALRGWRADDATSALTVAVPAAPAPIQAPVPIPTARNPEPQQADTQGSWSRVPVRLAAALAGVALVGLLAVAFFDPAREAAATPPSPTPTVAPSPTPPAWLAPLVEAYREACGPRDADQVAVDVAAMSEEEATDHVEELIDACDEKKPGKGNGGGGEGNGGGGGGNGD